MATSYDAFGNPVSSGGSSLPDAFGNYPSDVKTPTTQAKVQGASNTAAVDDKQKAGEAAQTRLLRYPVDNQDRHRGRISFQAVKVHPADVTVDQKLLTAATGGDQKVRESESTAEAKKSASQADVRKVDNALEAQQRQKASDSSKIAVTPMRMEVLNGERAELYIPVSFVVTDAIAYDNAEMGAMGAAGLQALQNTGDVLSAAKTAVTTGISSLTDMFSTGGSLNGVAARVALGRGAAFIPNQKVKNIIENAAQVTVNPNVRSIFRNVALREFQFQFKLIPTSAAESKEIKEIIRFFRKHAYPESYDVKGVSLAFLYPNMFKINITYNGQQVGTRIKLAYLRNISVNYNATSSSFHADGSPTEYDLSLAFVEHKTITREDIVGATNPSASNYSKDDARVLDLGSGF